MKTNLPPGYISGLHNGDNLTNEKLNPYQFRIQPGFCELDGYEIYLRKAVTVDIRHFVKPEFETSYFIFIGLDFLKPQDITRIMENPVICISKDSALPGLRRIGMRVTRRKGKWWQFWIRPTLMRTVDHNVELNWKNWEGDL